MIMVTVTMLVYIIVNVVVSLINNMLNIMNGVNARNLIVFKNSLVPSLPNVVENDHDGLKSFLFPTFDSVS